MLRRPMLPRAIRRRARRRAATRVRRRTCPRRRAARRPRDASLGRRMQTLRRYFVAGLLVWIPLGITLWVLKLLVDLMDQSLLLLPERLRSDALFGFHVPGLGVILTLAIVLATGALAASFSGSKLLETGDRMLDRIPLVR